MKKITLIALSLLLLLPAFSEAKPKKTKKKVYKKYYTYKKYKRKYRKRIRIRRYPKRANVYTDAERLKLREMVKDLF